MLPIIKKGTPFTLILDGQKYPNNSIRAYSFSGIISSYTKTEESFLALEPKMPIEESMYLQAHSPYPNNNDMISVEIR